MSSKRAPGLELPSYILAALTGAGGAIGYARTKSKPSLIAGTAVGLLYGLGGYRIANNESYGVELSLLASLVLGGSAFPRAIRLRKPVPIMLSLFAAYGLVTFGNAFRRAL
ncbi:transmembrane protein 14 [Achaetomium macrosporum]|uniref:Transmembrane protein 14 n=1 Tax=Achaetomium macrosporum TaxID=79813 RepID=A0AAN7C855_9PEZI|nr:transmembrane protein 14 [Achaetomium macrosporum]